MLFLYYRTFLYLSNFFPLKVQGHKDTINVLQWIFFSQKVCIKQNWGCFLSTKVTKYGSLPDKRLDYQDYRLLMKQSVCSHRKFHVKGYIKVMCIFFYSFFSVSLLCVTFFFKILTVYLGFSFSLMCVLCMNFLLFFVTSYWPKIQLGKNNLITIIICLIIYLCQ